MGGQLDRVPIVLYHELHGCEDLMSKIQEQIKQLQQQYQHVKIMKGILKDYAVKNKINEE